MIAILILGAYFIFSNKKEEEKTLDIDAIGQTFSNTNPFNEMSTIDITIEQLDSVYGINTENVICKIADTKSIINDLIRDKLEFITEITLKINELEDNTLEVILRDRYLKCKCWEQIAVDLNYSIRHVYKLHGKALESFERVLKRGQ